MANHPPAYMEIGIHGCTIQLKTSDVVFYRPAPGGEGTRLWLKRNYPYASRCLGTGRTLVYFLDVSTGFWVLTDMFRKMVAQYPWLTFPPTYDPQHLFYTGGMTDGS